MNSSTSDLMRYEENDVDSPLLSENRKEIKETIETRTLCLEILRKDLQNLKVIEPCLESEFLLRFLRVCKYDTSRALQRVINYYKQTDEVLEIYSKYNYPLHEADSLRHLKISPYRCKDNSFLLMGQGAIDYKKFDFGHRFYLEMIVLHTIIENPVNQIVGGTFIFDYEGMDIHGYLRFTPFWLRLFFNSLMNAFPCRVKAIHIVNTPSFFPTILKIFYRVMSKKLRDRVFFHAKKGDLKELHARIPPEALPEKYGGKIKEEELIDILENLKEQEKRVLRLFYFGNIKTKKAKKSFHLFQ